MIKVHFTDTIDATRLSHLDEEIFKDFWTIQEWDLNLALPTFKCITVYEGTRIYGFLTFIVRENNIRLTRFGVSPWHRREGLATLMFNKMIETHRGLPIIADVSEEALAGHLFLKSVGLRCIETKYAGNETYYRFRTQQRELIDA